MRLRRNASTLAPMRFFTALVALASLAGCRADLAPTAPEPTAPARLIPSDRFTAYATPDSVYLRVRANTTRSTEPEAIFPAGYAVAAWLAVGDSVPVFTYQRTPSGRTGTALRRTVQGWTEYAVPRSAIPAQTFPAVVRFQWCDMSGTFIAGTTATCDEVRP